MLKNVAQFEVKIGERSYQLVCATDSTWGEIHDALFKMKDFVLQKMNELHTREVSAREDVNSECLEKCQNTKEGE